MPNFMMSSFALNEEKNEEIDDDLNRTVQNELLHIPDKTKLQRILRGLYQRERLKDLSKKTSSKNKVKKEFTGPYGTLMSCVLNMIENAPEQTSKLFDKTTYQLEIKPEILAYEFFDIWTEIRPVNWHITSTINDWDYLPKGTLCLMYNNYDYKKIEENHDFTVQNVIAISAFQTSNLFLDFKISSFKKKSWCELINRPDIKNCKNIDLVKPIFISEWEKYNNFLDEVTVFLKNINSIEFN